MNGSAVLYEQIASFQQLFVHEILSLLVSVYLFYYIKRVLRVC